MSFAIDLATNGQELKKAYNQVLSSDPDTKWAVFGYSNDALDVLATGSSIRDFCSEFDDSQAQYGVAQVDHNGINKVVLVGWVGDGAPSKKRIAFNAHFASVARYFPGYHVQIFASESDELTPKVIASKVASGAGANYTAQARKPKYFQSETGANEDDWGDSKPLEVKEKPELSSVPTAYNKHKIEVSTQKTKPQVLEPKPKDTSKPIDLGAVRRQGAEKTSYSSAKPEKVEPHYKPVGKVNLQEIHATERKQAEAQGKEVEQFSSLKDRMNAFKLSVQGAKPQHDTTTRSVPRAKNTPSAAAKTSETSPWASKAATPAKSPSSSFKKTPNVHAAGNDSEEDDEDDDEPATTSVKDARAKFLNAGKAEPKAASAPVPLPKQDSDDNFASITSRMANKSSQVPAQAPAPASQNKSAAEPTSKASSGAGQPDGTATVVEDYEAEDPEDEISLTKGEKVTNIEKLDDFWWSGTNSSGENGLFPKENVKENFKESSAPAPAPRANNPPAPPARRETPPVPSRTESPARSLPPPPPQRDALPSPAPAPPARKQPEPEPASESEEGVVYVIAAYEAEADDEISLKVNEKITNVDKLDENWWAGTNTAGDHGLFPVENVSESPSSASAAPTSIGAAAGVSAIAIHDYEADEEDELGFKKGDKIVNIEFPSADWWSGEIDGRIGLFPPDFVELQ